MATDPGGTEDELLRLLKLDGPGAVAEFSDKFRRFCDRHPDRSRFQTAINYALEQYADGKHCTEGKVGERDWTRNGGGQL